MSEHELWNELGNLYFISGMFDQAAYAYNRSIKIEERFGMPYSNLAFAYAQKGRFSEAADLFQKSIELLSHERDRAISWYRLGDVYRHLKNYRDAIMAYQQADLLYPEAGKIIEGNTAFLYGPSNISEESMLPSAQTGMSDDAEIAHACYPDKARDEAETNLNTSSVQNDPVQDIEELSKLSEHGMSTGYIGDESLSVTVVSEADKFDTDAVDYLFESLEGSETVSDGLVSSPDVSSTLDEFQDVAVHLAADEPMDSWEETVESGYTETANTELRHPGPTLSADLRTNGVMLAAQETVVEVIDKRAVFIVPDDVLEDDSKPPGVSNEVGADLVNSPELRSNESLAEKEKNEPSIDHEIARLEQIIQGNPRNASKWDELGALYKSANRYKDAVLAYQQAVLLDSNCAEYHHSLGVVYAVEGRHEDAINCLKKVIAIKPDHGLAHATLGGYLRKMGLEELANQHIGIAVKNFIDDGNEYNRACLEALCGNVEQAVEYLRIALDTRQTLVEWILRDPDLDGIRFTPQFKQLIAEYVQ
ncbi:MAG: tetratricopeptide repeat protein [Anaerolineales bacterium]|nr:MAG: tetratricopeptide repeat protein [Anaerolineales bacterium]